METSQPPISDGAGPCGGPFHASNGQGVAAAILAVAFCAAMPVAAVVQRAFFPEPSQRPAPPLSAFVFGLTVVGMASALMAALVCSAGRWTVDATGVTFHPLVGRRGRVRRLAWDGVRSVRWMPRRAVLRGDGGVRMALFWTTFGPTDRDRLKEYARAALAPDFLLLDAPPPPPPRRPSKAESATSFRWVVLLLVPGLAAVYLGYRIALKAAGDPTAGGWGSALMFAPMFLPLLLLPWVKAPGPNNRDRLDVTHHRHRPADPPNDPAPPTV